MFKKYLLCTALLLMAFSVKVFPSGIQVSNTTITMNTDKKSTQVKFTLMWDNSWRLDDGPKNWDAAWVFIKYRTLPGDSWNHGFISTTATAHKVPTNAEMKVGTGIYPVGGSTTVGVGAFIYRKAAGSGTITFQDVELNWAFTQNGLTGGEQVEVCVLATEMVYIPSAAFYLGDQTSGNYIRHNYDYSGGSYTPWQIAGEAAINLSNCRYNYTQYSTATVYVNAQSYSRNTILPSMGTANVGVIDGDIPYTVNYAGNTSNTAYCYTSGLHVQLPAAWPKGFNAFYCMKYEITQGEYVQFLNKNILSIKNASTNPYWTAQTTGRSAIVKKAGTGTSEIPAEFELSTPNAAFLPCGWLGTKDVLAWLAWSGLRPMTEFEFEKVCRGTEGIPSSAALKPQYAWGKEDYTNATGFSNKGGAAEGPSNNNANCAFAPTTANSNTNMDGPLRAGGFASPTSTRVMAGAAYYGVMEMSGNIKERCITVSHANGRAFTGIHGNGEVGIKSATDLNPNLPAGWPPITAAMGLGFRGGSYLDLAPTGRISDRAEINSTDNARKANYGGRGVRTAP